jgi:hypothetical protein
MMADQKLDEMSFFSNIWAGRYWLGWSVLGVGVATLGGATAFGIISNGAESDARNAGTQVEAWQHRDKAEKNALVANILFGVGGAAVITSVVLLYLEYRQERSERKRALDLAVIPTPGGAAFSLGGRF